MDEIHLLSFALCPIAHRFSKSEEKCSPLLDASHRDWAVAASTMCRPGFGPPPARTPSPSRRPFYRPWTRRRPRTPDCLQCARKWTSETTSFVQTFTNEAPFASKCAPPLPPEIQGVEGVCLICVRTHRSWLSTRTRSARRAQWWRPSIDRISCPHSLPAGQSKSLCRRTLRTSDPSGSPANDIFRI